MTNETQQTAMQQMYNELMAHEYTIPLELIVKCKELIKVEEAQIMDAYWEGKIPFSQAMITEADEYYNETYGDDKQ